MLDPLNPTLFLGFHVDRLFQNGLQRTNPIVVKMFINNSGDYLQEVEGKAGRYIGKKIAPPFALGSLENLEANIRSIAMKLVNGYDFSKNPLILFPLSACNSQRPEQLPS